MLIEQPLGNLANLPSPPSIDWIDVTWQQCLRRAFRSQTRSGLPLRVLLPIGIWLRHEDVLWFSTDERSCIALNVLPADVLVGMPVNAEAIARISYEIGNLHLPMKIDGAHIIVPADGPVEAAFVQVGVPFKLEKRRFQPTCRSMIEVAASPEMQIIRSSRENV